MGRQGLAIAMAEMPPANPIRPDSTAQIVAIRCLAIVTASIALGGFIVWYGLGGSETYPEMAASIARHSNDERYLFNETSRGIYVALPPGAVAGTRSSRLSTPATASAASASVTVATPPLPRAKPLPTHAPSTPRVRDQQAALSETAADESTATDSSVDAQYQPEPAQDVHEPSTFDDQLSAQPVQDDDSTGADQGSPAMSDDASSWQTSAPAESDEEPAWDESPPDEPLVQPESDPPT